MPSLRNQPNLLSLLSLNKCVCLCVLVPLQEGLQSVGPKIPRRFFKRRRVARFSRKRFFRRTRRTRSFKRRFRRFSRRRRSRRGFSRRSFKGANRSGYWVRSSAPRSTRSTLGGFRNRYFSVHPSWKRDSFSQFASLYRDDHHGKNPYPVTYRNFNKIWWARGTKKPVAAASGRSSASAPFYKDYPSRLRAYKLATAAKYLTPQYWVAAGLANRHRLGFL